MYKLWSTDLSLLVLHLLALWNTVCTGVVGIYFSITCSVSTTGKWTLDTYVLQLAYIVIRNADISGILAQSAFTIVGKAAFNIGLCNVNDLHVIWRQRNVQIYQSYGGHNKGPIKVAVATHFKQIHCNVSHSKSDCKIISPLPACRGTLSLLVVCLSVRQSVTLQFSGLSLSSFEILTWNLVHEFAIP